MPHMLAVCHTMPDVTLTCPCPCVVACPLLVPRADATRVRCGVRFCGPEVTDTQPGDSDSTRPVPSWPDQRHNGVSAVAWSCHSWAGSTVHGLRCARASCTGSACNSAVLPPPHVGGRVPPRAPAALLTHVVGPGSCGATACVRVCPSAACVKVRGGRCTGHHRRHQRRPQGVGPRPLHPGPNPGLHRRPH